MLCEMGYSRKEASRALRFCSGDVGASVTFIAEQRTKQQVRSFLCEGHKITLS